MTPSLNRAQEFHRRIAAALLQEWDPIGVSQEPHAQDEYDSYVHASMSC